MVLPLREDQVKAPAVRPTFCSEITRMTNAYFPSSTTATREFLATPWGRILGYTLESGHRAASLYQRRAAFEHQRGLHGEAA